MEHHLHAEQDWTEVAWIAGPYSWGIIHHAAATFPCTPCAEAGDALFKGVHDVVNHHTGKPIQFPRQLEYLRQAVAEVPRQAAESPPSASAKSTTLETEVARLAQGVGLEQRFPRCDPSEGQRFERCVQQVKAEGSADSPFGICTVSIGCSPGRKAA